LPQIRPPQTFAQKNGAADRDEPGPRRLADQNFTLAETPKVRGGP
jgi:hypothetical protein